MNHKFTFETYRNKPHPIIRNDSVKPGNLIASYGFVGPCLSGTFGNKPVVMKLERAGTFCTDIMTLNCTGAWNCQFVTETLET